jgi:hypothetical protein
MSEADAVRVLLDRIARLGREANAVLATHEAANARLLTLEDSYATLTGLTLDQDELFREALRATEVGLFRAAHVLAWAGFNDFLHEHLFTHHLASLKVARPKWTLNNPEDLRDWSEFAVIEAGKASGAFNNTMMKALHGLLNRRNECAHPSDYFPDLNEALGYIGELFKRITQLGTPGSGA